MSHVRETSRALALPALLLAVALLILSGCASTTGVTAPTGTGESATPTSAGLLDARFATAPPLDWDGPVMSVAELPPEALLTLELIAASGPFPHDQDGSTFQNRERLLPDGPEDRYAEYTVKTPGSADRGPRRLVVGDGRDVYYTDDHYDSFRFVTP
jgi:ribonuclease T1